MLPIPLLLLLLAIKISGALVETRVVEHQQVILDSSSVSHADILEDSDDAATGSIFDDLFNAPPKLNCAECQSLLVSLKGLAHVGEEFAIKRIIGLCNRYKLQDPDVCEGAIRNSGPAVVQVLRSINPLSYPGQLVCATLLGVCPYPDLIEANITFPPPPVNPTFDPSPDCTLTPLEVVHFSDWHFDPLYVAGTEAICSKPLCCRDFNSSSSEDIVLPAPSWGSYQCDTPLKLAVSMLQSVESHLHGTPDFAIFTGDVPPHDVWLSTPDSATEAEHTSFGLLRKHLNTKIYPTVGNHESSPTDLFQPSAIAEPPNNQYLYDNLTQKDWDGWLDADSLAYAQAHRGSYSAKPVPGLKIISLNSVDCYTHNFWMYADTAEVDPNGQLAWFANELLASEAIGEKVWVISHVSAGAGDCFHNWSNLHNKIIGRYYKTISGIFSGHSHRDEYQLYYNNDTDKSVSNAIAVGWLGPSVTSYTRLNPGWRRYKVDPMTFEILDSITYIANLSLAAEWDRTGEEPTWFKEYSAREYLPSWPAKAPLNATFWALVTAAFEEDDTKFQAFYQHRSKMGPGAAGGCDEECKLDIIGGLRRGNSASESALASEVGVEAKPWAQNLCASHL